MLFDGMAIINEYEYLQFCECDVQHVVCPAILDDCLARSNTRIFFILNYDSSKKFERKVLLYNVPYY